MRRSLLVTVTNYLGSTQFYLTITHQRIVIVGLLLAALSLVVGNSVLVWLGNAHNKLLQQAESMQLEGIQSKDKIQKLQTSVAKLLPASKIVEVQGSDFRLVLKVRLQLWSQSSLLNALCIPAARLVRKAKFNDNALLK